MLDKRAVLDKIKEMNPEDIAAYKAKTEAALSASAARAFAAMAALDPNHGEREELRVEGVAQNSIDALYPLAFAALVPGLIKHLTAHPPHRILRQSMSDMLEHAELAYWGLPKTLVDEWVVTRPKMTKPVAPELAALETCLSQLLDDPADGDLVQSRSALIIMWSAWWLSAHRRELHDSSQRAVDGLMCWTAQNLLPELSGRQADG